MSCYSDVSRSWGTGFGTANTLFKSQVINSKTLKQSKYELYTPSPKWFRLWEGLGLQA